MLLFLRKIKQLFSQNIAENDFNKSKNSFSNSENNLNEISAELVLLQQDLAETKKKLDIEKQKFYYHLQIETDGVAIFDENFHCLTFNHKFLELANSVLEQIILTPEAIFESSQKKQINEALQQQICIWQIEKNNKIIEAKLLKFEDNSFELLLINITKKEKASRFKKQIIDNLSHELKTPLCSIQGYLETIINNPNIPPEKLNDFVKKAFEQSERMTNLMNDISKINRIEQADRFFELKKINIKTIIDSLIYNFQNEIGTKNVKLEINIDEKLNTKANEELFSLIFSNLISNSLAYAGENFKIGISAQKIKESYINFVYFDTGKGIETEYLNRIFERFYRIDKGRSQKIGGTGLGLAIVKNSVQFHSGNIIAKTHKSGGLEFVFGWKV
jgi:signal transduction histidine kinase